MIMYSLMKHMALVSPVLMCTFVCNSERMRQWPYAERNLCHTLVVHASDKQAWPTMISQNPVYDETDRSFFLRHPYDSVVYRCMRFSYLFIVAVAVVVHRYYFTRCSNRLCLSSVSSSFISPPPPPTPPPIPLPSISQHFNILHALVLASVFVCAPKSRRDFYPSSACLYYVWPCAYVRSSVHLEAAVLWSLGHSTTRRSCDN